ncbi:MAG: carboxypeptidase regulatory-like domain-containing protein [Gammaproteobacteria bacterium]|nr:carboxypeptidase regulatory-like domain-containing protein [Gammaproteobacteria bacterium]
MSADGAYRFNGLPNGTYKVSISHPEYMETSKMIDVDEGYFELDFQLEEDTNEF